MTILSPRASIITFTPGGHDYAERYGLSSTATPQHAEFDDSIAIHSMDSAQHLEMIGAPGQWFICRYFIAMMSWLINSYMYI